MKKFLWYVVLLVMAIPVLTSCSDSDDQEEYYVRYSMGVKPGDEVFMSVMGTDGETIVQQTSYAPTVFYTVGPVHKGFEASMAGSVNGGHAAEYLQIEVSSDDSPFVTAEYLKNGSHIKYTVGK
ncbi:hypothetical protein [uncultured Muribaculum sp.]|uniref:hypothetical protein n=1 Tax=uncultured Muribaculum sp. TaxID=1918613 RepID=UPI0025B73CAF|nr:hypothetical protein [uncultured Muribaculum sp.]